MRRLFMFTLLGITNDIFNTEVWLASQKFIFIVVFIVKHVCFKMDASLIACCNYLNHYSSYDETQMYILIYYIHIHYAVCNRITYKTIQWLVISCMNITLVLNSNWRLCNLLYHISMIVHNDNVFAFCCSSFTVIMIWTYLMWC